MNTNLSIEGHKFSLISYIQPDEENGIIKLFHPQERFNNSRNLSLHRYGNGPFCKFSICKNIRSMGVYIIDSDGIPNYVGECKSLSNRFNNGYGNISPRNCFAGGQMTNCRINNLICQASLSDKRIRLWFMETTDYKKVEAALRASQKMNWNLV